MAGLGEMGSELWDPRTGARSGMKRSPRTSTNRDAIFTESRDHRAPACFLCSLAAVEFPGVDVGGISAEVNELRLANFLWRNKLQMEIP